MMGVLATAGEPDRRHVPSVTVDCPGAEHLIVVFPGVSVRAVAPETWRDRYLRDLNAHRLFVGTNCNLLLGAAGAWGEAVVAAALITDEAWRLGVSMDNVICIGPSFAGSAALYIGLKIQAGLIIAGAPTVRLGIWVRRLFEHDHHDAGARELFDHLYELSEVATNPGNEEELDDLIPGAVRSARHGATVNLFASRLDDFFGDSVWLRNEITFSGLLRCDFVLGDYLGHERLEAPYYQYVVDLLRDVLGSGQ